MKKGKEIKLNTHKNYTVSYGSINSKNPIAVYAEIRTWALPNTVLEDYSGEVKKLHKKVKSTIYKTIDNNKFNRDFVIVDLDLRSSGISTNKRSFMRCEITLYQRGIPKPLPTIKDDINNIVLTIISGFEGNSGFSFTKKKMEKV